MPVDERTERCKLHPGLPAVARCDQCAAPLCLDCAIPVRGGVLDALCLGLDATMPVPRPRPSRLVTPLTGAGFALAAIASALPWRKYGIGSGPFGAWGTTLRWSVLAGVAAILGLLVWAIPMVLGRTPGSWWTWTLRVGAGACGFGAMMHLLHPPVVGPQSFGATVAIIGSILALVGTLVPSDRMIDSGA